LPTTDGDSYSLPDSLAVDVDQGLLGVQIGGLRTGRPGGDPTVSHTSGWRRGRNRCERQRQGAKKMELRLSLMHRGV
jgi:hypothetical protein